MSEPTEADERLDRVGIHLHHALQALDGDLSADAQSVRLLLYVARRRLADIRRRHAQARVGRWIERHDTVGLRIVEDRL